MDFWCFLAIFELMSDSLTTTQVEPNQCPSHKSILLTQEPIHEIFTKKYWELAILKTQFFWVGHFGFFFFKKIFFFASSPWKLVKATWLSKMGQNLDAYLGFLPKITQPKHFTLSPTGYQKRTRQFFRALHVYSIDNFVAFWLKWLEIVWKDSKWVSVCLIC